jgi:peptidoglycan hydrolase-like protein with peptidoglycan-binding domain
VARLESLNKSIVDAGKKILDQARKNLQNRRQSEDNAKTETDIAKKENRLAALRANTSGGNQVEIAQLQKEINDARQNYGRTLEDQLLSRLQTQSDEAAAQRQEQIDLAKQQIELNSLNGVYFQEADALLTNVDAHSSEIKDILTTTQEETTGKWGAQVWEQELEQKIGNAITAEAGIPQLASVIQSEGSALREALVSANASSTSVSGTQSASTASIAKNPVIENKAPASIPKASSTPAKSASSSSSSKYPYGKASDTTGNIKKGAKGTQVKAIQYALKQLHYVNKKGKSLTVDGNFGADTQYAVKNFQKKRKIKATGIVNDTTRSKFRAMGYKTGGIADYTGPAWLDGTPSKPEMVLNAQDTKNFIALKDILAGVMHDISHMDSNETYNAPMEFNINVNVDKISNDYDVDKLANRLKKDIVKDMSYRNVTQVRKFR